jgi:hypothetical protein
MISYKDDYNFKSEMYIYSHAWTIQPGSSFTAFGHDLVNSIAETMKIDIDSKIIEELINGKANKSRKIQTVGMGNTNNGFKTQGTLHVSSLC